ncbi:MAG: hypothetical protein M3248_07015, partial [Actinomycetota bacterium]|nr:hypothetical protein [Actinomycetota bacterium]
PRSSATRSGSYETPRVKTRCHAFIGRVLLLTCDECRRPGPELRMWGEDLLAKLVSGEALPPP